MQSSILISMPPQVHCAHSFISLNYHGKLALKPESRLKRLIFKQHYGGGRGAHWSHQLIYYLSWYCFEGGRGNAFISPAADVFFGRSRLRGEVFVNIARHVLVLFKQWITKRAQGILRRGEQREQRRFAYPQSVREINKLPQRFFKNKQLSKSHSGAPRTPPLLPEIKSQQRGFFLLYSSFFFSYCSAPLYVSI